MERKNIGILGSTGSIGTQTLNVVDNSDGFNVVSLSANKNVALTEEQIRKYAPDIVCMADYNAYKELKTLVSDTSTKIVTGNDGILEVAAYHKVDTLVTSVVGIAGLMPTIEAIKNKKNIALANKETLVVAGDIIKKLVKEYDVSLLPVDSEHSAIFQCIQGMNDKKELKRILLTASGGPFYGKTKEELINVSAKDAVKHPKWNMGAKISVDSSTLMNKGLEVIEATYLFDVSPNSIEVVIHPESIIHSMVEFSDNSIIAQLSNPDMRLPIQYALTYPNRYPMPTTPVDFKTLGGLTFGGADDSAFPCLSLAYKALEIGGSMMAVLNGANEALVDLFLKNKIKFYDIPNIIKMCMDKHNAVLSPTISDVLNADVWARETALEFAISNLV